MCLTSSPLNKTPCVTHAHKHTRSSYTYSIVNCPVFVNCCFARRDRVRKWVWQVGVVAIRAGNQLCEDIKAPLILGHFALARARECACACVRVRAGGEGLEGDSGTTSKSFWTNLMKQFHDPRQMCSWWNSRAYFSPLPIGLNWCMELLKGDGNETKELSPSIENIAQIFSLRCEPF